MTAEFPGAGFEAVDPGGEGDVTSSGEDQVVALDTGVSRGLIELRTGRRANFDLALELPPLLGGGAVGVAGVWHLSASRHQP